MHADPQSQPGGGSPGTNGQRRDRPRSRPRPGLSVVVPVHNGGDRVLGVLDALMSSNPPPFEVIIADDASTDDAVDRARARHPAVRIVRVGESPSGPSAARNAGVRLASAPVVVFVDADVRVHPETLETLTEPLRTREDIVATFGSYDDDPEATTVAALYGNLRHHVVHQAADENAETFWSGLGAVRREAFEIVGGFDASFGEPSIEDVELGTRLRALGEIRVVADAQATHLKRWTVLSLWRTDIFKRAVPWGRLAAERPSLGATLNASHRERLSAALLALALLSLVALPWSLSVAGPLIAAAGVVFPAAGWGVVNRTIIGALRRRGGIRAAIGGSFLHAAYYIYAPSAYLLSLAWHRWRLTLKDGTRAKLFVMLLGIALLGIAGIGSVLVVLGLMDSAYLLERLLELERDAATPRYDLGSLAAAQRRLLVVGGVLLAAAGAITFSGPRRWQAVAGEGVSRLSELFAMPRSGWVAAGLLTAAYTTLGAIHLNQQMRLDEAASFSMFAGGSPFVALATYDTPNNHMLHSALMWLSVRVFGPVEWSARLPAFLAAQLIPLCMIAAGRRLLSPSVALLGTALFVGSTIGVDIATNARGYPMVIVAMLVLIGLLPALRERRPGARASAAVIGAIGIFACPVMAYPLAVVYAAWFFGSMRRGSAGPRLLIEMIATGIGTLALAALAYAPAWALRTGQSPVGVLDRTARIMTQDDRLFRPDELMYNLHAAWAQWTAPLPAAGSLTILALAIGGIVIWIAASRPTRSLAFGLLLGPLCVFGVSRFASPPWWILVWLVPLLALLVATPISRAIGAVLRGPRAVPMASAMIVMIGAATVLRSDYPREFPYRTGMRDAPAVAETLLTEGIADAQILTLSHWYRLLNFEFEKRGLRRGLAVPAEWVSQPTASSVIYVHAAEGTRWREYNAIGDDLLSRLRLVSSERIGVAIIDRYEVIGGAPAAEPSE